MQILDANVILRYILNDISSQYDKAVEAIEQGASTTTEIIAEVIYVLSGVYKISREDISWFIHCLLLDINVENKKVLQYALGVYNQTKLDFVDCILIGYQNVKDIPVMTFDKKLNSKLNTEFRIYYECDG